MNPVLLILKESVESFMENMGANYALLWITMAGNQNCRHLM
jgi:hypothetical protein